MDDLIIPLIFLAVGVAVIGLVLRLAFFMVAIGRLATFEKDLARQMAMLGQLAQGASVRPDSLAQFSQTFCQAGQNVLSLQGRQKLEAEEKLRLALLQALPSLPQGQWPNGGGVSGRDIYMPNGPALVNGQLYIPRH